MSEQFIIHRMEDWGYYLLPKSHPDSPGYTGLIIAIRKIPTRLHFDPESIHLRLSDENNLASWMTLRLNSPVSKSMQVCPGRVVLTDRVNKRIYFFVFGGTLEAVTIPGERVYSVYSPAPVLVVTKDLESFPDQLVFEVEALLGKIQAKWGSNDRGFARRLAQIDPFQFYLASLQTILETYKKNKVLRESWPGFYSELLKEKTRVVQEGQWPTIPLRLEDLLVLNRTGKKEDEHTWY